MAALDVSYENSPPAPGTLAQAQASFDSGGPVDVLSRVARGEYCASWVQPDTTQGRLVQAFEQTGVQQWSYEHLGVPYYAPSFMFNVSRITTMALGTFVGAYHGYQRNRSAGWATLWGVFGFLFPLPTLGVAAIQGYGKPKRRSTRT